MSDPETPEEEPEAPEDTEDTEAPPPASDAALAAPAPEPAPDAHDPEELLDTLRRVQADFENFRKRVMREQTAQVERAAQQLVEQLLPVLDSFELAMLNLPEPEADDHPSSKLRKGIELVYAEFLGVLERNGLQRIEAAGKPFDPNEHDAVMHDGDPGGAGSEPVVTEVMRSGYRFKGRVLRPAMVRVGA